MEECKCDNRIGRILTEKEKENLKNCCILLDKSIPDSSIIAELIKSCDCPHLVSFGFKYYCCNKKILLDYLKRYTQNRE